jgi:3alpha(or 20beta)-hydroxysteroid dehydrogenase
LGSERQPLHPARLDGRAAIVSGGARGIGAAHVQALAAEGAAVLIGDVLEPEGEALAHELGERARFQPLDVTLEQAWAGAVAAAEQMGAVTILVTTPG